MNENYCISSNEITMHVSVRSGMLLNLRSVRKERAYEIGVDFIAQLEDASGQRPICPLQFEGSKTMYNKVNPDRYVGVLEI